jgi:hypothetical protein
MGRERVEIKVTASLSRHNSDQDDEDDVDWMELVRQLEQVCQNFKSIQAEVQ